jgi:hypothetical protein
VRDIDAPSIPVRVRRDDRFSRRSMRTPRMPPQRQARPRTRGLDARGPCSPRAARAHARLSREFGDPARLRAADSATESRPRRRDSPADRTFHSANWIEAHLRPLAAPRRVGRICVVSTFPIPPIDRVPIYPPSRRRMATNGRRCAARLLAFAHAAFTTRPHSVGAARPPCRTVEGSAFEGPRGGSQLSLAAL